MASSEKNYIPSSDPDNIVPIPISDYAKKLDVKVGERYLKKISTIGIDPVLILREGKRFEPDCLPPVESTDLLCYLVLETSFYTQKQFKSFRSLEAYNQMVSGFVSNDLWLSHLASRQLLDRLEAFRQNHISHDLDFGLESNLDRTYPTVLPLLRR